MRTNPPSTARWCAVVLAASASLAASPARAADADEKRAEALFREGREALARGDNATACARFGESVRLTRRAGPLLNVAQCDEQRGDIVAALARWNEGLSLLPAGDERVAVARARVEALDKRVPKLTIRVPAAIAADAVVKLDGATLDRAALDAPRPVAPGAHEIVVSVPARPERQIRVQLAEGDRREIVAEVEPQAVEERGGGRRTAGFVVGGVGVVGLLVGAITGGLAIAKKGVVVDNCVGGCNAAARDARDSGKALANASTATLIVGGAALVAGIVLVATDRPKAQDPKVAVRALPLLGGGAIALEGAF